MKSSKNFLLALFFLATLGLGGLAWHQYLELIALRGAGLSDQERADLRRQIAALEKRNAELKGRLAAQNNKTAGQGEEAASADAPDESPNGRRRGGLGREAFTQMRAIMDSPEFQKMQAAQRRTALDGRYASLFKKLNLSPEQLEKFKSLLLERQNAARDVLSAARDQGLDIRQNRDRIQSMIQESQSDIDTSIQAVLGTTGFEQYQQYEQTQSQRNLVSQLQQSLSYTSTPLSDSQVDKLVQILAQTTAATSNSTSEGRSAAEGGEPPPGGQGGGPRGLGGGMLSLANTPTITDQTISQSQSILSTDQLQALTQLQQQQKEQQAVAQLVQKTIGNRTGNSSGSQSTGGSRGTRN